MRLISFNSSGGLLILHRFDYFVVVSNFEFPTQPTFVWIAKKKEETNKKNYSLKIANKAVNLCQRHIEIEKSDLAINRNFNL